MYMQAQIGAGGIDRNQFATQHTTKRWVFPLCYTTGSYNKISCEIFIYTSVYYPWSVD